MNTSVNYIIMINVMLNEQNLNTVKIVFFNKLHLNHLNLNK